MNTHDKKANQDALRNVCTLLECAGVPHLQGVADSETGTRLEDGMYQFSFDGNAYTVAMHSSTGQWYLGSVTARVNGALHTLPTAIAELRGLSLPRPQPNAERFLARMRAFGEEHPEFIQAIRESLAGNGDE